MVKLKTAGDRFGRSVKRVQQWCRRYRHAPVAWQHEQLTRKLRGHDAYYGVRGNYAALVRFRYELGRVWQKWLNRRSNQSRMSWERFNRQLKRYAARSSLARQIRDLTSRMREIRTSGSVGGPGGRPPGPTRQGEASRA